MKHEIVYMYFWNPILKVDKKTWRHYEKSRKWFLSFVKVNQEQGDQILQIFAY
jgi:hypothetical protein